MGDAARRRALNLPPRGYRPAPDAPREHHVLGLIDRRMERDDATGEVVFSDHSAKPGPYASADLKTLYQWDGKMVRRLDRRTMKPHNEARS